MNRHYALITNDMSWKAKAVRKLIISGLQCLFVTAIECFLFLGVAFFCLSSKNNDIRKCPSRNLMVS